VDGVRFKFSNCDYIVVNVKKHAYRRIVDHLSYCQACQVHLKRIESALSRHGIRIESALVNLHKFFELAWQKAPVRDLAVNYGLGTKTL